MKHPWDHFYEHNASCVRSGPGYCDICKRHIAYRPDECEPGQVYRLHARNLEVGVYVGHGGWMGIREKFGDRYLDTEYEGSCRAMEKMNIRLPDGVTMAQSLGTKCSECHKIVKFTYDLPPREDGIKQGTWSPMDGSASCVWPDNDRKCRPVSIENRPLFDFLANITGGAA